MMVTNVTWKQGLTLPHDPDDIGDIEMDMTAVVGPDDTLTDADVVGVGVEATLLSSTPQGIVIFRVEGGYAGQTNYATVHITMDSGREQSRTVNFNVLER